jgi:GR25 family glycosyltransferase involved in LPS biosynthesis
MCREHENTMDGMKGIKIIVISLPGSPRRQAIAAKLAAWGVGESDYIFSDGVRIGGKEELYAYEKESMDISEADLVCSPMLDRNENGDLGCLLAHLQVYRYIISNNLSHTLVIEDDIDFCIPLQYFTEHAAAYCAHDYMFVHPEYLFGTQGQIVSLAAAKHLWDLRRQIIELGKPIDLLIWHKFTDPQMDYVLCHPLPPIVRHAEDFWDADTSERLRINNRTM